MHDLLAGRPYIHLHFLFLIAGLYLVTPLLATSIKEFSSAQLRQAILIIGFLAVAANLFDVHASSAFTMFVPYLAYYLAGWYCIRVMEKQPRRYVPIIGGTIAVMTATSVYLVSVLGLSNRWSFYPFEDFSPTGIVLALSVFTFILHGRISPRIEALAQPLAPLTLGVYLAHPIVVEIGVDDLFRTQLTDYRVPKNINLLYTLGFIVLAGYAVQVLSGILLLVYYIPHPDHAFNSVQDLMKTVPFGWLFRQMHIVGGNLMIVTVFLHMVTVFLMGNYKRPRELTWAGGALLLALSLLFGVSGYLLPWSQLSYWATTVVTSMPTAFPYLGDSVSKMLRGGEFVSGITLSRFFALHVAILPPLFMALMALHIFLVRRIGISGTPFGKSACA